eukprot:769920-Pyramimonas_sp.AAC.1
MSSGSKRTGPAESLTRWHGCCRGAARYLENAAAAKGQNEVQPSDRVHLAQLRKWETEEPAKWRTMVMSLVVSEGQHRARQQRQLVSEHLDQISTWSAVE